MMAEERVLRWANEELPQLTQQWFEQHPNENISLPEIDEYCARIRGKFPPSAPQVQTPVAESELEPEPKKSISTIEDSKSEIIRENIDLSKKQNVVEIPTSDSSRTVSTYRNEPKSVSLPEWHAPWKLMRVVSGHSGWVRCIAVDWTNEWFATGSMDRTIKIWDLATGQLQLTLTGNIHGVRGLSISQRSPYLFSVGEDKTVRCWDLEQNKVIRYYHGHLSGVYCCDVHPELDVLVTGGRDSSVRIWDVRTKNAIHVLSGHNNIVASVKFQSVDPQLISASHDSTIRCWDIVAGKTRVTLTNHKKSVRDIAIHPREYTFCSASSDHIKVWHGKNAQFTRNITGHHAILNSVAINEDNVLVSAGDDGSMYFWDWKTGYNFQQLQTIVQPGSLESEAGIFACTFDRTGCRLITCEADKTIKFYKEDSSAVIFFCLHDAGYDYLMCFM